MSDKIEPCPWCGGYAGPTAHWARRDECWGQRVVCLYDGCETRGPVRRTEEAAIAAWNEVAGLRAEVERLKADLATGRDLYVATCNARSNPFGVGLVARGM